MTGRAPAPAGDEQITGITFQFSGRKLITCTKGLQDDKRWFRNHHGRNHRIRKPLGGERNVPPRVARGATRLVVVRQVRPGARIRLDLEWVGELPLNSEVSAASIFAVAAERHQGIVDLMASLIEGSGP
jgi:hypothetical protein